MPSMQELMSDPTMRDLYVCMSHYELELNVLKQGTKPHGECGRTAVVHACIFSRRRYRSMEILWESVGI